MARTYELMTQDRRDAFIEAYKSAYGNFSAACRAMAPHADNTVNPPARSTWIALRESDPAFRQALENAHAEVKDMIFEEVRNRALNGTLEAVYQKGSRVWEPLVDADDKIVRDENGDPVMKPASIRRYDSRLLLRLASRLDPAWSEKVQHEHAGTVEHRLVTMGELNAMTPGELEVIDRALAILENKEGTKTIEHKPELPIIDVPPEGDTLAELEAVEAAE